MGVKGLGKFVSKFGVERNLSFYTGKKIAIDTSIYLYKFMWNSSSSKEFLKKFHNQINNFKRLHIEPTYVFDGKPPDEKQGVLDKRHLTKVIKITSNNICELQQLFQTCGVKYIISDTEGEKYCTFLNKKGYVDLVLSNDYDCLAFGCKILLVSKEGKFYEFSLDNILANLGSNGISHSSFVDMCIVAGTDYAPRGIPGLGLKKALKFVKERGELCNWGIKIPETLNYTRIKEIFSTDSQIYLTPDENVTISSNSQTISNDVNSSEIDLKV